MAGRTGKKLRHLSADEKLKILEEARAAGTTVAEMLRRHRLDATTFYRWDVRRKRRCGRRSAVSRRPAKPASASWNGRTPPLGAELAKKRQVIAEAVEENAALKRGL